MRKSDDSPIAVIAESGLGCSLDTCTHTRSLRSQFRKEENRRNDGVEEGNKDERSE